MIIADEIKKLDERAYRIILEKGIDINKPILKLEDVHEGSWGELTQRYLMNASNWEFSLDEVRRIHSLSYCGKDELSEYKKKENAYISKQSDYILFIPALPEEIPEAMAVWYEKYKNYRDLETIICAEMEMATMHPFSDGNGRTGFFLMRAMMYSAGYKCALHLNIDKFVYDRYKDYMMVILKSTGRGWGLKTVDYEVYIQFFMEILEAAYNQLISVLEA